jgi:hypothetical protein
MNCYTHHEKTAVGLCRSCGRALCPDCVVMVENSVSCSGRCEERVHILNMMVEKNAQIISTANKTLTSLAVFLLIMGAVFMVFGAVQTWQSPGESIDFFLIILGLVFFMSGIFKFRKNTRYPVHSINKTPDN